ncbi:MAG: NAD(P)(+) transhydrogenase (Re/Si-specific) subunit beta [Thermoplasmata archaeon]|nr:NAD(P)(+) transhydrogenase (Re/Si-specific) subunit beta [Thermoplasmata archaeon]
MTDYSPLIDGVYVLAVIFFILGLRAMASPDTARRGILAAGVAMLLAILVTFLVGGLTNFGLIAIGIIVGGGLGWYWARVVKMTAMPQMVAVFNGMGGGAAAAIAAVELLTAVSDPTNASLSIAGAVIGSISIAGSVVAFLKLQGWMVQRAIVFPAQQVLNLAVLVVGLAFGVLTVVQATTVWLIPFFVLTLLYGILLTLRIGGADMPVVISLFNALTGIAVALDGFVLVNGELGDAGYAMVVAGILVGAAGSLLTIKMARAMNRSIGSVLFGGFGAKEEAATAIEGSLKPIDPADAASLMAYANQVIIAPGYGMAVAQAQRKVKELADALEAKGVSVRFAIHPVAGRMPGHMNVLLAEAGVSYDKLYDLDEVNGQFATTDVVLVIGANDVVNPAARRQGSPLFGMPILDVDKAKNVFVIKRGQGRGFAGVENDLFYKDNCRMLYGDASAVVGSLITALEHS